MTFLLWLAGFGIGVLIFMAILAFYAWFDDDGRYPIVESYCDSVRIQLRSERRGNMYWVQGRVFGFWVDYSDSIADSYAKDKAEQLIALRKRLKNKEETVEEYKL